jgi:hypothetical protein
MILFDLVCSQGHSFEAWFRDNDSFERLVTVDEIQCAICGDTKVKKALMAPKISSSKAAARHAARDAVERASASSESGQTAKDGGATTTAPVTGSGTVPSSMTVQDSPGPLNNSQAAVAPEKVAEAMKLLRKVQTHIEQNFDHVGKRFAEEARKMHYGEAEKRSIYGEATQEDAEALADEGIEVNQMPWLPNRNS